MSATATRTRVLVTVLTYPHPSAKYKELVCTAGVTAAGEWIRLYPVDYRYRPAGQRFHKYQWIELDVEPVGHDNDRRKESRKPHLDTRFFMGTRFPDNTWQVLGVFYPPRIDQTALPW